jgi:acyl carrier protein
VNCAEKLQRCFRAGLALATTFDVTRAESGRLRQWDSVAHLQLVVAIEDAFGIELSPADVVELASYPAAVSIIRHHGAWPDA